MVAPLHSATHWSSEAAKGSVFKPHVSACRATAVIRAWKTAFWNARRSAGCFIQPWLSSSSYDFSSPVQVLLYTKVVPTNGERTLGVDRIQVAVMPALSRCLAGLIVYGLLGP